MDSLRNGKPKTYGTAAEWETPEGKKANWYLQTLQCQLKWMKSPAVDLWSKILEKLTHEIRQPICP